MLDSNQNYGNKYLYSFTMAATTVVENILWQNIFIIWLIFIDRNNLIIFGVCGGSGPTYCRLKAHLLEITGSLVGPNTNTQQTIDWGHQAAVMRVTTGESNDSESSPGLSSSTSSALRRIKRKEESLEVINNIPMTPSELHDGIELCVSYTQHQGLESLFGWWVR